MKGLCPFSGNLGIPENWAWFETFPFLFHFPATFLQPLTSISCLWPQCVCILTSFFPSLVRREGVSCSSISKTDSQGVCSISSGDRVTVSVSAILWDHIPHLECQPGQLWDQAFLSQLCREHKFLHLSIEMRNLVFQLPPFSLISLLLSWTLTQGAHV